MNKDKSFFIKQLDEIIQDFNIIKSEAQYDDFSVNVDDEELASVLTKSKAATERIVGRDSEYYKDIDTVLKRNTSVSYKLKFVIGTIMALKSDLQNDYLKSFSDIIRSEVFSDYLEMAEHLLREGYKDPSAVLAGSTLEVHLRELCLSLPIEVEILNSKGKLIPKKAEVMNSDLAKAGIYSSAYQKQVTAWLGLRNSAAHGKYEDYKIDEISLMLQGIRQFIIATK